MVVKANQKRDDLCKAIGSCNHGFAVASPLSLHDGKTYPVYAYGIDSSGGANAALKNSPRKFTCSATVPEGIRRKVSKGAFQAWEFSAFWDVMPLTDAALAAIDEGSALPESQGWCRLSASRRFT